MGEESYIKSIPLYQKTKLPNHIFNKLKECVDFEENNKIHPEATNVENEFVVKKIDMKVVSFIENLAKDFYDQNPLKNCNGKNLKLTSMWINKQKKCECNQLHNHIGDISFATWIKIPYDFDDEINFDTRKNKLDFRNAVFQFVYTDPFGKIIIEPLGIDKSWEGSIMFFDSRLNHQVYPFYTSDDYRISISGNLSIIENDNKKISLNYQ